MQTRSRLERYQNLYSNQNEENERATQTSRYNESAQPTKSRSSLNANTYQENAVRYNKMIKEHEDFLNQMEEKYSQIARINPSFETPNTTYQQPSNRQQNTYTQFQPQQNPFIKATQNQPNQFTYQSPNNYNQPQQNQNNQQTNQYNQQPNQYNQPQPNQFNQSQNDPFEQQVKFAQQPNQYEQQVQFQQQAQYQQQASTFNQLNQFVEQKPQVQNIPFVDPALQSNPYVQNQQNQFEQNNNYQQTQQNINPFDQTLEKQMPNPFEEALQQQSEVTKDDFYSGSFENEISEDTVSLQFESVKVAETPFLNDDAQFEIETSEENNVVDDVFATEDDAENSAIDETFASNVKSAIGKENNEEEKISIYTEEKIGEFFDEIINAGKTNGQEKNVTPVQQPVKQVEKTNVEEIKPVVEKISPVVEQVKHAEEIIAPVVEQVKPVIEKKEPTIIETPIVSIINAEELIENSPVESIPTINLNVEEKVQNTTTIEIQNITSEETIIPEKKVDEPVKKVNIVVESVEEEPIDAIPIEQASMVKETVASNTIVKEIVIPQVQQPVVEKAEETVKGTFETVIEESSMLDDIVNEISQPAKNEHETIVSEQKNDMDVSFIENELLEGKEIVPIIEEKAEEKTTKEDTEKLVIDDKLMNIINEVKKTSVVAQNEPEYSDIEGDFDDITRILDEVKSYSKTTEIPVNTYNYEIDEEKDDEPTLSEIIKTKETTAVVVENNDSIQELTQRIEQERAMREELLEKTRQLNVQISEYENEVDDLSSNMNKTGKLLNVVITILVIALFFIIIVIGYWFFQERGLI